MYFNDLNFSVSIESALIMNKMGFKVSVTTYKEYYDEGKVIIKIIKVPKNFPHGQVNIVKLYTNTKRLEAFINRLTMRMKILMIYQI